ncbi:MAG: nicotinate-nucleotide adenylyltransferase [Magnetococcus sp. DMHC-6]
MSVRMGIFGGAFNPPHYGHLRTALEVKELWQLDHLLWIPSGGHPFKPTWQLAATAHRLQMTQLAITTEPSFAICPIEAEKPGIAYTVDTLTELTRRFPLADLVFILGADLFEELHKWKQWQELDRLAALCVLTRPGCEAFLHTTPAAEFYSPVTVEGALQRPPEQGRKGCFLQPVTGFAIRSRDIRALVAQERSIRFLTPDPVIQYIHQHKLYLKRDE